MAARLGVMGQPTFEPMRIRPMVARDGRSVRERELEAALVRSLGLIPSRSVARQLSCHGLIPDVVIEWGRTITIVELKRWVVDDIAVGQLRGYLDHWRDHLVEEDGDWTLLGVLAAPAIRPDLLEELPRWCAFQPLIVERPARSRAA